MKLRWMQFRHAVRHSWHTVRDSASKRLYESLQDATQRVLDWRVNNGYVRHVERSAYEWRAPR